MGVWTVSLTYPPPPERNLTDLDPGSWGGGTLKQGDALFPLLFNFSLKYAIGKLKENKEEIKLMALIK
jgi:hypothetical protein